MSKFDENVTIEDCPEYVDWIEQRRHEAWVDQQTAADELIKIRSTVQAKYLARRNTELNIADHMSAAMEVCGFVLVIIPAIVGSIIFLDFISKRLN